MHTDPLASLHVAKVYVRPWLEDGGDTVVFGLRTKVEFYQSLSSASVLLGVGDRWNRSWRKQK